MEALAGAAVPGVGEEEPHARLGGKRFPAVYRRRIEGQGAFREGRQGTLYVYVFFRVALLKEAAYGALFLDHLPREPEEACHVIAVVEPVDKTLEGLLTQIGRAHV